MLFGSLRGIEPQFLESSFRELQATPLASESKRVCQSPYELRVSREPDAAFLNAKMHVKAFRGRNARVARA